MPQESADSADPAGCAGPTDASHPTTRTGDHATTPDWTITKAEWDGVQRRTRFANTITWVVIAVQLLIAALLLAAPSLLPLVVDLPFRVPQSFTLIVAVPLLLFASLQLYGHLVTEPRWDRFRPVVWEARGCACPWCQTRVDEQPCTRHGYSRAHHAMLLGHWEAVATMDLARATRLRRDLRAAAPRTPLHWRILAPVTRVFAAYQIAGNDPDSTPWQRLRAALPWLALEIVAVAVLAVAAGMFVERRFVISFLGGCWPFIVLTPFMAMIGPGMLRGRLRCTACNQPCTTERSTQCPECGADLTQPGAVTRVESRLGKRAPLMLVPLLLLLAAPYLGRVLISALPTSLRHAVYRATEPPHGYWQNLVPATMDADEIAAATDLLITHAAPGGARPLFDFDFLPNAIAAGKLSNDAIERAARAVVQARLEFDRDGDRITAVVQPDFGALVFGRRSTPRLVFGGVSVDGGAWSPPAAWSLFLHDIEAFWRANGQLRVLPEDMLVFRTELGTLEPGTHTVRARCWIVLHGATWERYVPTFDADGNLIPPSSDTRIYELQLESTISGR